MKPAFLAAALAFAAVDARAACKATAVPGEIKLAIYNCQQEVIPLVTAFEAAVHADNAQAQADIAKQMASIYQTFDKLDENIGNMLSSGKITKAAQEDLVTARRSWQDFRDQQTDAQAILTLAEGVEPPPSASQAGASPGDDKGTAGLSARELAAMVGHPLVKGADNEPPENKAAQRMDRAGDDFLAKGRPDQARQAYEAAAKLSPKNPDPLLRLAALSEKQGDLDAERNYLQRAIAADPGGTAARIALGHAEELARAKAKADVKGGFKTNEDPVAAGGGRGSAEAGMIAIPSDLRQDYASALAALSPPRSPALAFVEKAERFRRLRDSRAALLAATQAIDVDKRNAAAWTIRADVDNDLKNYEAAVADAGEALKLRPDDAQALRARAYAYFELGNYQAALADIHRAVELDPSNGAGWLYQAMIEEKLGDLEDAKRDYLKAVQLDPALKPLAADAFQRLGLGGGPAGAKAGPSFDRKVLLRGGAAVIAGLFIVLGLLGTRAGKDLTTSARAAVSSSESEAATLVDKPASAIRPGTVLDGHYRVESELGRGGMGVVFAAVDETLERKVAIKQLQRNGDTTSEDLQRFLREARLVAKLKHPNIAEIYAVVEDPELCLIFERIDGRSLDKVLQGDGRRSLAQTRRIIADVCGALDCAHSQKIIHRDLKPSNVMVCENGACKVMDFGIAHQSSSGASLTRTSASGTPPYMAPEQTMGSVSKASDYYALAVMAYELLTAERPFEGPDYLEQKLNRSFVPALQRDPALPRGLDVFFARAFDPDPTRRPASAAEFLRDFEAACLPS